MNIFIYIIIGKIKNNICDFRFKNNNTFVIKEIKSIIFYNN